MKLIVDQFEYAEFNGVFTSSVFDWNYLFCVNFVQRIKLSV